MSIPNDPRQPFRWPFVPRGFLFIPPTSPTRHGEMENIKAYVKFSELSGRMPTPDEFVDRLQNIGLRTLMHCLSNLMTVLHVDGVATPGLQPMLRDQSLSPAMLERLRRFHGLPPWHERIVFFPQQILFTMKMALLHSPDRDDPRANQDEFRDPLVELLLMAADFLDNQITLPEDRAEAEGRIVAYLVQDYLLNMREQLRYLVPRASLLYIKLPSEPHLRGDTDFIDLAVSFQAATGLDLKDYLAFGFMMAGWWGSQSYLRGTYDSTHEAINPATFFANSTIDRTYATRLLWSFVQNYETARAAVAARPGNPAARK